MSTQRLDKPQLVPDLETASTRIAKGEDERANHFVLWGFIIMLIGAAIGVVGKKILYADVITVVGVLTSLAGIFLVVYPYLRPTRPKEHELPSSSEPDVMSPPQSPDYLPQESSTEYIPSVTEKTTDLLTESTAKDRHKKN